MLNRHFKRPINNLADYTERLRGLRALEIGGTSKIFSDSGGLPIYSCLASLDNANFAMEEMWHGNQSAKKDYLFRPNQAAGKNLICEGNALLSIADNSYDAVISSNVIEHFANPIKAVKEWSRVVRPGGYILTVTPEKNDWIDHRRMLTTWEHILSDYASDMQENDTTHVEDVISNTDRNLLLPNEARQLEALCLRNLETRAVHHHTFNTALAVRMMLYAGLDVVAIDKDFPTSIITLAQLKH
jgi:SAM-dependent methyltransferase